MYILVGLKVEKNTANPTKTGDKNLSAFHPRCLQLKPSNFNQPLSYRTGPLSKMILTVIGPNHMHCHHITKVNNTLAISNSININQANSIQSLPKLQPAIRSGHNNSLLYLYQILICLQPCSCHSVTP